MKYTMMEKTRIWTAENAVSTKIWAIHSAEGRWNAYALCLFTIGRPVIVDPSSEKAWKALNSRLLKRTPPLLNALAEVLPIS